MKKASIFILGLFLLSFQSCITMSSAGISGVKPGKGTEVQVSHGALGILALTAPREIVQKATDELRQKGVTGNVSTTLTMRNWGIVQYYRVVAVGQTDK